MSDQVHLGTRKGLFTARRGANGWALSRPEFAGRSVGMTLSDPSDGALYAAVSMGGPGVTLQRSRNGAATWSECGVPADPFSGKPVRSLWALETAGGGQPGVIWAGGVPGGLFRSGDGGDSWEPASSLYDRAEAAGWIDGCDQPGIHSFCVDPGDPRHISVGISCAGVWSTFDGGVTWESRSGAEQDAAGADLADIGITDTHRVVQCAGAPNVMYAQCHDGIYRTADGGAHWQTISRARPTSFGFAAAVHPTQPDTAWFVPLAGNACRIPVDARFVVTRTRDAGETWETLNEGLPTGDAYDIVYRHAVDVDETGSRLAMGSTTGGFWVSENGGDSWICVSDHLPPVNSVRFAG